MVLYTKKLTSPAKLYHEFSTGEIQNKFEVAPALISIHPSQKSTHFNLRLFNLMDSITKIQINVWTRDSFSMIKTNAGTRMGTNVCANLGNALLFGYHQAR